MMIGRLGIAIGSLALFGLGLAPTASADQWDKKTILTVHETIQVPNKVLPPGKYVFKLLNSASNRHVVVIYNEDQTELLAMIAAIPNYQVRVSEKSRFLFWETPPGQPRALRAWFYPGDNFGQEFAYPKVEAVSIAAVAHKQVPSTEVKVEPKPESAPVLEEAPVAEVTPKGEVKPVPEEKAEFAQNTPPPTTEPAKELPTTASPYPLIGLVGLLSLATAFTLRLARKS